MTAISKTLKALREKSGLRQGQIAEFLGVTQTYISKVENGERNLTADQLEDLANLYGYSLAAFQSNPDNLHPIRFAFRAQDMFSEDLKMIAEISKIAINSRFMTQILEGTDD